jgi:diguanylate cyclase (GGDEF)-like protein/PAS domain S-box-containing protein
MQEPRKPKPVVLTVDDDPAMRLLLTESLDQAGYEVIEAGTAEEAIERIRVRLPDAVLMDVRMPGMNGFEACAAIRKLPDCRLLPVVIVTGLNDMDSIEQAYHVGATDFITKPINWPLLPHRLRNILRSGEAIENEHKTREMLNVILDSIPVRVFWKDRNLRYLGCNRRFAEDAGLESPQGVIGHSDATLPWAAQASVYEEDDRDVIDSNRPRFGYEQSRIRYTGERLYVQTNKVPLSDAQGRVIGVLGTYEDITARKAAEARIQFLAQRDSLTGLPNRALFGDRLRHAIAQAQRGNRLLGLMFLDLDRFKAINDSLGHGSGDNLLIQVGERLKDCMRESDTVSRLGGDEFTVILETLEHTEDSIAVADKILDAFKTPFTLNQQTVFVTASIGIALYPLAGESTEILIRNADIAMYQAKESGRNRYCVYSTAMHAGAKLRLKTENDLRNALEGNQFELWYQPQYDMNTNQLNNIEALLRWNHLQRGLLPPEEFLSELEETELIIPVGEWALRAACRQAKGWLDQGLEYARVAVNLSSRQFSDPALLDKITRALRDSGLEPTRLELEINENCLMQDSHAAVTTSKAIRALGVKVALDDFGVGYSSMNYLKYFSLDTMKIDRVFVQDLPDDGDEFAIVNALIALARSLSTRVVVEGVESIDQFNHLRALGDLSAQGFLMCPPQPAENIIRLLEGYHVKG